MPVASDGVSAIAVPSWHAGTPAWSGPTLSSRVEIGEGHSATVALAAAHTEPLVIPGRSEIDRRLAETIAFWQRWSGQLQYDGPWDDAVRRSALTLKALIFAPSGASVAAPTTSWPEEIGGERNWDYRYCWIRDSNFAIGALLELGCYDEAQSLFWWFMQATALTEPKLHVLYRLDGGIGGSERTLPLAGHRGSRPCPGRSPSRARKASRNRAHASKKPSAPDRSESAPRRCCPPSAIHSRAAAPHPSRRYPLAHRWAGYI